MPAVCALAAPAFTSQHAAALFERLFKLQQHGTTVQREVVGGLTTFAAMAYILAVNPSILSASGMDTGAVITATAVASALMTAVMALATNYPIALAPGMGMNAFFAFTICGAMKVPWQSALGVVFCSGLLFLLLSVSGARKRLLAAIPAEMKIAISCGIGLFILLIGLKNGGVIVGDAATLVRAGQLNSPIVLLVLGGIALTGILVAARIPGAIIIVVALLTIAGLFVAAPGGQGSVTPIPHEIVDWPASLAPTFLKFDPGFVVREFARAFPLVLALLFVDLFDNMGTLIAVCQRAGLTDERGDVPRVGRVLAADATAAMVGSSLGTSTVTSYIESAAGIEAGGRTGLTALVVSVCFLLALFFHPLIRIVPAMATAPALVIVGVFMMQGIRHLDLSDFRVALPGVMTMVLMPLTFSISEGLALGFLTYVLVNAASGRARQLPVITYVLAVIFAVHVALQ